MKMSELGEPPFTQINHMAMVVKDVDKAVEHYEALGIGPFVNLHSGPHGITVIERKIGGKPADDIKNITKGARIGQIELHLIQPAGGWSLPMGFLEKRGEGLHHLAFSVDDLDKEVAKLEKKGFKVLYRAKFLQGGGYAWFNFDEVGGVLVELTQWPPKHQSPVK